MEFLQNVQPREYQKKIFETCIEKNCLVVLPTGLGKTLIALMLAIERMKKFPGKKTLFLAPTKPLAEQHLNYFKEKLPETFAGMDLFTGQVSPKKRKEIWEKADMIFSTPQCIANDLKNGLYNLEEVCLLIEDEAHRCIKNYDYTYVAQAYKKQAKNPRILGLTASPGSELTKIKEICNNLSIEEVEIRTRKHADVAPYVKDLKFEKVVVDFPEDFEKIRENLMALFHGYVSELRNRKVFFSIPTKTELIKLQKRLFLAISRGEKQNFNMLLASSACAQAIKIQHALELLETQTLSGFNKYLRELFRQAANEESKGVVKLVKKPEFNFAFIKTNELVSRGFEHPKMSKLFEIVKQEFEFPSNAGGTKIMIFSQFRETVRSICEKLKEIPGVKPKVFVGQGKRNNGEDATSLPGLNQKEQKKIIQDFSSGKINVLCATSIGEEGLDIPEVNVVVFYEPVPSAIRAIQRAGRTARLSQGKLIILVTRKTRDESFFYVSKAKERKMHSAIDNIKKHFSDKKFHERPNHERQETLGVE